MARPSNRIDEELVCIDSVCHVLESTLGLVVGTPARVEPGKDPPDFWVQVDNVDTPVEVTSIIQRAAFRHHARQMAKTLKERALDARVLSGTYLLKFRRFPPVPHPRRKCDQPMYDAGLDYITDTANLDEEIEQVIFAESSKQIVLRKFSPFGATVEEILTNTEWAFESQENTRDLIDVAAQAKIEKLSKTGHSPRDTILALYDAYAFLSFDEIAECTADLLSLQAFAAVYWASAFAGRNNFIYPDQPGRDGGFITSTIAEWRGANSLPSEGKT
ncbi:hypothetical protein FYK55_17025 [Roseiconus nitratireducens]|uniref:Uncharacterized protein n=1 Tax=Roseiconus nitratireducens TaxID=2605748 RepID=A0A5M6D7Q5_9BACT|nr:hypothetical protein [Roseiconus nitratireducens]KAA5541899.1 hypothetical protein FYK55_17025 [Roseiconus nitratireducens]